MLRTREGVSVRAASYEAVRRMERGILGRGVLEEGCWKRETGECDSEAGRRYRCKKVIFGEGERML